MVTWALFIKTNIRSNQMSNDKYDWLHYHVNQQLTSHIVIWKRPMTHAK